MKDIKNSSGKVVGNLNINDNQIIINTNNKPQLIIEDKEIIKAVKEKNRDNNILKKMYDEYFLTVGEIAALYDVCYSNLNKQMRQIKVETTKNQGRRNSSYGQTFSEQRK